MTHTAEQKAHILSIVEADLDGVDIEYHIQVNDKWKVVIPSWGEIHRHPERYRLKARTVKVSLCSNSDGLIRSFCEDDPPNGFWTKIEGTELEHTIPPKAPETQSDEIELVEFQWEPSDEPFWGDADRDCISTPTGRTLKGHIVEGRTTSE